MDNRGLSAAIGYRGLFAGHRERYYFELGAGSELELNIGTLGNHCSVAYLRVIVQDM